MPKKLAIGKAHYQAALADITEHVVMTINRRDQIDRLNARIDRATAKLDLLREQWSEAGGTAAHPNVTKHLQRQIKHRTEKLKTLTQQLKGLAEST